MSNPAIHSYRITHYVLTAGGGVGGNTTFMF